MQVDILPDEIGIYTLCFGKIEETNPSGHYVWLDVYGVMDPEPIAEETYKYTITVTRQPGAKGNIKLEEVGVRLPVGYEYKPGSAASFLGDEPFPTGELLEEKQDEADAYMYKWGFDTTANEDDPPATQTFHIIGEGGQEGDYSWVQAQSGDIDVVGEVVGKLYRIEAIAKQDGKTTATVVADVMLNEGTGEIRVILWQVNP
ncbi:hypothetical protein ES703_112829 [subsurface metagenome]